MPQLVPGVEPENPKKITLWTVFLLLVLAFATSALAQTNGVMVLNTLTIPRGGVWLDSTAPSGGAIGGHWWQPDQVLGICRADPQVGPPPFHLTNCQGAAKSGGQAIIANPGQNLVAGLPAGAKFVFVPDASTKSVNVVRYVYNPAGDGGLSSPLTMSVSNVTAVGGGSGGGRPVALALAPNGIDLYVGYIKSGDIMMITGATTTTSATPPVTKIGSTSDGRGVNALVMFRNDMYLAETGGFGLSRIPDPAGLYRAPCAASAPCTAGTINPQIDFFPGGLATDGNYIYIGDSPLTTPGRILRWDPVANIVTTYSVNVPAYVSTFDNTSRNQYVNPWGLGLKPDGTLMVGDDPTSNLILATLPTLQGHLWSVAGQPQPLSVTSVGPNFGTPLGGTLVTITGTGFSLTNGATSISFGGNAATNVSCSSTSSCTALSPAGTGVVDVRVTVAGVTSPITLNDQFSYAAVRVTSISPTSGPVAGGTAVSLSGLGFSTALGGTQVFFGATASPSVNCTSTTTCSALSPAGTGAVPITATVAGQSSLASTAPLFTYLGPVITKVTPNAGPLEGGTIVSISGSGFNTALGGTTVLFGANPAASVSCASSTSCTATSPAGLAGTVDIVLTAFGASTTPSAADQFTYQSLTVSSISPTFGPASGGTSVTITGTGFSTLGDTTVTFGTALATGVSCLSSISCTAVSPAGSGSVDVIVHVGALQSPAVPADVFTYAGVTVASVSPTSILATGGTAVTITGTGFSTVPGATTVAFGLTPALSVTCSSSSVCIAAAPAGTGTVDVVVTANAQSSPLNPPADQVTYVTPVATLFAWGITAPKGGMVWVPGNLGGHFWSSDHANGFCRQDPVPATALHAINYTVCDDGTIGSPGQAVYDARVNPAFTNATNGLAVPAGTHFIYVPDNAVKSTAVWRLTFDPNTETLIGPPEAMVPLADVRTLKPNGMALGPDGNLIITDLTEANIRRLTNPNGDPRLQTISIVAVTGDGRGANGTIGFIGNRVYISENRAATWFDITQCPTALGPCATNPLPLPTGVFVAGVATDPVHGVVYAADSPGGANATIWRYEVATNLSTVYLTGGQLPAAGSPEATVWCALTCTRPWDPALVPGGTAGFSFAFGINVDPVTSALYITDDATAGARAGRGHAWVAPFVP